MTEDDGRRIAERNIRYSGQLAGIAADGLAETFDRDLPPLYSKWTLCWWLGTMLVVILGAVLMCFGFMWAIAPILLAWLSCAADARFGLWE